MTMIDAVLIDDNPWIRDLWEDRGRKFGKIIRTFASIVDFMRISSHLDRSVPIFVDFRFGNDDGTHGKKIVRNLTGLGFSSLFLATAFKLDESPEQIGVRAVVGKEPPAWLVATKNATSDGVKISDSLTAADRTNLLRQMSEQQRSVFKSRLSQIYDAVYGSAEGLGAPPPAAVVSAWEDAAYRSVSDAELQSALNTAWQTSLNR